MNIRLFGTGFVGIALALAVMALAAPARSARAADLPCGIARLIVPWAAGGDTDIIFRSIVEATNRAGAKPQLQVVNSAGQGGTKGAREVKGDRPDGCTLLALHDSAYISFLSGRVDFTWDAFEPVALMTYTPSVIGASAAIPFNDMKGLVAEAKQAPGALTTGATLGSTSHFVFLVLEHAAGIKLKYVPYEGTRERLTALLAKNIQLGELNIITAKQYLAERTLKALGIATERRDPSLPDVPTLKEQGIDLVYGLNRGVVVPKGTRGDVVAYWEGMLDQAAKDPEVAKILEGQGTRIQFKGAKDYAAFLKRGYEEHEKVALSVGMFKK
ncbi:MAG: tripartite tricarboxylate transporter substrate binding protein [Pseudomonadota bacterium]